MNPWFVRVLSVRSVATLLRLSLHLLRFSLRFVTIYKNR
nr:MAG TPA: hypothetical protein [Caudoviricetes sp.]